MTTRSKARITVEEIGDGTEVATGAAIKSMFGTGSVVVMTEAAAALVPTSVNGVDHCIMLRLGDTHQFEIEDDMETALEGFYENSVDGNLTLPCCYRSEKSAWGAAAELLESLAAVCRQREKTGSDKRQKLGPGR